MEDHIRLKNGCTQRAQRVFAGVLSALVLFSITISFPSLADPAPGASCTASVMNRNGAVAADYSYLVFNVPANQGPLKTRATCSDGTVGQSRYALPVPQSATFMGPIEWGVSDPVPLAISLSSPTSRFTAGGQTAQLVATAIDPDGTSRDITTQIRGTFYTSSNPLLATVSADGLVTVTPLFSSASSARIVITATNEGLATNTVLTLGPQGRLRGSVLRADGITPVSGAQVTVQRNQPLQQVGTFTTDSTGNYDIADVAGGRFTLSVIDPVTGDRGRGFGAITADGETAQANVRLNGQGSINIQVVDGAGSAVPNVPVTASSLTMFQDTRTILADANGLAVFTGFPAGDLAVSTRQASTNLLGTAVGSLGVNGVLSITLRLQPIGSISGTVFAVDGITPQGGIELRLLSAGKGLITQLVTAEDGRFAFDSLPLADGPYTLDALLNGRLRARVPGILLTVAGQDVQQNVVLTPVGSVTGQVLTPGGAPAAGATVVVQSLGGLRPTFNAVTAANGSYRVDGVPQGNFAIAANGSGATATANGVVAVDGEVVTVNIQLQANGLVGVVYGRDGQTPVGAGVAVTLKLFVSGAVVQTTATDAQGGFGFAAVTPNNYLLDAADNLGNRGRTQLAVTTIDATEALVANIAFIGRGRVAGVVRDANGAIQANLPVTFISQSVFGGTAATTTDAAGRYQIEDVFVGGFDVSAKDSVTTLAGTTHGTLLGDAETAVADITLRATGSVIGQVTRADGITPLVGGLAQLTINGSVFATQTTGSNGNYRFDIVPLGEFAVLVTDPVSGDKGLTNSRLSTLNEVRTTNVRLLGLGQVAVRVVDSNGQPVAGAQLVLTSGNIFGNKYYGSTASDGTFLFGSVLGGDFSLSAVKPVQAGTVSGSVAGTVIAGSTVNASITIIARPMGRITGVIYAPDSITPLANATVRLIPVGASSRNPAIAEITSSIDGRYTFDVEGGNQVAVSVLINGRARARSDALQIGAQDQVITQDVTVIGVGTVRGVVTDINQLGVGGIAITVNNPDPLLGGRFLATTQADGSYSIAQVPAGNVQVTASNAARTLRAEGTGRVGFDGDNVTVDLVLVNNAVAMPYPVYDANNFLYDIQGNGSIGAGTSGVFSGNGNVNTQGMRLDIVTNGVALPFTNGDGSIGSVGNFGQEITLDEFNGTGLKVTRRVFVPKTGYFVRYLETIENLTSAPVTVDVRITTNISQGNGNPRIVDSSDRDEILSVTDPINRDRWVVIDDLTDGVSAIPPIGHVFDGTGAAEQVSQADFSLVGTVGKLQWQWGNVTVPPGATVSYMHFGLQQLNRSAGRAAAERLALLPPEVLEGLSLADLTTIRNFVVPLDGVSGVTPLPAINTASIQGRVFAGDSTTPIPAAEMSLQSTHPLFGRTYTVNADAQGAFTYRARANGDGQALVIPQDTFTLTATHPVTRAVTPAVPATFPTGVVDLTHDLVFINTGNLHGVVTRHNGSIVVGDPSGYSSSANSVRATRVSDGLVVSTPIDSNGNYGLVGLPQGDYALVATAPLHPQGSPLRGESTAAVVAGQTAIGNVVIQPTGSMTGIVRTAGGEVAVNVPVAVDHWTVSPGEFARISVTDTAGRYVFTDIPVGDHNLLIREVRTNAETRVVVPVAVDQSAVADVTLPGVGTLVVQVNFQRASGTPNAQVELVGGADIRTTRTDTTGRASFTVPVGTYRATAAHPDNFLLREAGTATLATDGGTAQINITLPMAGTVAGVVYRADGVARAARLPVTLTSFSVLQAGQALQTTTDAQGAYRIPGVPEGNFYINAIDTINSTLAEANAAITADGVDVDPQLTMQSDTIPLPATRHDVNNFPSDIQQDGSILRGLNSVFFNGIAPHQGANQLEIIQGTSTANFSGHTNARVEALGRQLVVTQPAPIFGLRVSRKVYVPSSGYFTRYIEILENQTAADVTVDLNLSSRYATTAGIITTSSGDTALQTGAGGDYWVVLGDTQHDVDPFMTGYAPATAHVIGSIGGVRIADSQNFGLDADGAQKLTHRWNNVTVPAGGKVELMHFVVQQLNRTGAAFAADRLVQLASEAVEYLTPAELASVINFGPAPTGPNSPAPLPSLAGSVNGFAYEGDGTTPVSGAYIRIRSSHPLFGRIWQYDGQAFTSTYCGVSQLQTLLTSTNGAALGAYSMAGRIIDGRSVPVPVGSPLSIEAVPDTCRSDHRGGHPRTGVNSPRYEAQFVQGANSLSQNIVFPTGFLTGTVVGPADLGVTSGYVCQDTSCQSGGSTGINNDGTFTYIGLAAGTYPLYAFVPHPQAGGSVFIRGSRIDSVVTVGRTTVSDIQLEPTGAVSGAVVTAGGELALDRQVELRSNTGAIFRTTSDSLGRYRFAAIPVGSYTLVALDPLSGASSAPLSVAVGQDQTTVQTIQLVGIGVVELQVNYARGIGAFDAPVYLRSSAFTGERLVGRTDLSGHLSLQNIPIGDFTFTARHSENNAVIAATTGRMSSNAEVITLTIALPAVADVQVTVVNLDNNNVPVVGATVNYQDSVTPIRPAANTDSTGRVLLNNVSQGPYTVVATNTATGATGTLGAAVNTADDGLTIPVTLGITTSRAVTGVISQNYERDIYSVPVNQGDIIAVRVEGTVVNASESMFATRVQIYDLSKMRVAEAIGYDARNGSQQSNVFGDATNTMVQQTGHYTIAVSNGNSAYPNGGYRLSIFVNNLAVSPVPYPNSGTVQGYVYRADGITPAANRNVHLYTFDGLRLDTNVATDTVGFYQITGIPPANFEIQLAGTDGVIETSLQNSLGASQVLDHNLILPIEMTLQFQTRYADSTPAAGVRIDVQYRFNNFLHQRTLTTGLNGSITMPVYGSSPIATTAHHPGSYWVTLDTAITTSIDGATIPIDLTLPALGAVSGRVTNVDGTPVNGARIAAYRETNQTLAIAQAETNAQGDYLFSNYLPVGEPLTLKANAPGSQAVTLRTVTLVTPDAVLPGQDFILSGIGSAVGQVVNSSGNPVANIQVSLDYIPDQTTGAVASMYASTNATGQYLFTNLPVGRPLTISAHSPANYAITSSTTATLTSSGQQLTVAPLILPALGRVNGQVLTSLSGNPLPNVLVTVTDVDSAGNPVEISAAYTNAGGSYSIANLPINRPLQLKAVNPRNSALVATVTITIVTEGQDLAAPPLALPGYGNVAITVVDALAAIPETVGINARSDAGLYYSGTITPASPTYRIFDVPVGNLAITITANYGYAASVTAAVVDGVETTIPITLPVVHGSVRHADGTPAAYAYVYASQVTDGTQTYGATAGADGDYRIYGVAPGAFTLVGTDNDSGLNASLPGQMANATSATRIDVVLPASGTVTGIVRDSSGAPVSGAIVELRQATLPNFVRSANTDVSGTYTFNHVGLGAIRVDVSNNENICTPDDNCSLALYGTASGQLSSLNETVAIDVNLPGRGTVRGTLYLADGVTPIPGASIYLSPADKSGPWAYDSVSAISSADGTYEFINVPAMEVTLTTQINGTTAAQVNVLVVAGTSVFANLTVGTAVITPYTLDGIDGFRYIIENGGRLSGGTTSGVNTSYGYSYDSILDESWNLSGRFALPDLVGRQLTFGPYSSPGAGDGSVTYGQLLRTRKVYIPLSGGFARYLDILTNVGPGPSTVRSLTIYAYPQGSHILVPPAPLTPYAITSGLATQGTLAHVYSGNGAVRLPVTRRYFTEGDTNMWWSWDNFVIEPGQTMIFMYFAAQRDDNNLASAQAQAETLSNLTDPQMLDGLSVSDKEKIVNFSVP